MTSILLVFLECRYQHSSRNLILIMDKDPSHFKIGVFSLPVLQWQRRHQQTLVVSMPCLSAPS